MLTVLSEVNPGPVRVPSSPAQAVPLCRLPLVAIVGQGHVLCDSRLLPFRSGSIRRLRCSGAFEYLIDDELLMLEAARVLAPGARIEITAPNTRGLGRLDGLNAFRYVRDTMRRGAAASELAEVGWRRHYSAAELTGMMVRAGFQSITVQTAGVGLREFVRFGDALIQSLGGKTANAAFGQCRITNQAGGQLLIPAKLGASIVASGIRSG